MATRKRGLDAILGDTDRREVLGTSGTVIDALLWQLERGLAVASGEILDEEAAAAAERAKFLSQHAKPDISLSDFVREAFHVVEPARELIWGWHIDAICDHLEAASRGEIKRLIINIPPRHMKSMLVCVLWQPWEWTWAPWTRWLYSAYAGSLATRDTVKSRRIIQSSWYKRHWGSSFSLTSDQNEKTRYENDKTGYRIATSVGASATGEGGDRVVIDDPLKASEAHSDRIRESVNRWWDEEMASRLNDPKESVVVNIMQRLHTNDLSGHMLEQGGWVHLRLPMEYEKTRPVTVPGDIVGFPDLGHRDPRTKQGEILWEERFSREVVEAWKRTLGPYGTAGQLQQRPSPAGGGIFHRKWWRFWKPQHSDLPPVTMNIGGESWVAPLVELPQKLDRLVHSWDLTFDGAVSFDVGQAWAKHKADSYLLGELRGQWEFPEQVRAILRLRQLFPNVDATYIEAKANAKAAIATLRSKIPGLILVEPEGDKVTRARAVAIYPEAGNVYLPHPSLAPWIWDWIEELALFPNGPANDRVDVFSQTMRRLYGGPAAREFDPDEWEILRR